MADYYPLIVRAVAGLPQNTEEARRALYDRARSVLVAQLRGQAPTLSESEITLERQSLDEAIRNVEAETRVKITSPVYVASQQTVKASDGIKPGVMAASVKARRFRNSKHRIIASIVLAASVVAGGVLVYRWETRGTPTSATGIVSNVKALLNNPSTEKYELITHASEEFGIMASLSLRSMRQSADCTGGIEGKVDFLSVAGKPLELQTNDIVQEDNKAWIVTKNYGKIRIGGGFAGDHPPSGLCWWLAPSQQAQLKSFMRP